MRNLSTEEGRTQGGHSISGSGSYGVTFGLCYRFGHRNWKVIINLSGSNDDTSAKVSTLEGSKRIGQGLSNNGLVRVTGSMVRSRS